MTLSWAAVQLWAAPKMLAGVRHRHRYWMNEYWCEIAANRFIAGSHGTNRLMVLYGRHISVSVAGLVITEPRIRAVVERQADATETTGSVAIYNLAPPANDRYTNVPPTFKSRPATPIPSPPYSRGRCSACATLGRTWRA